MSTNRAGVRPPDARGFLDETRNRFRNEKDEPGARGAWLELRMLGRLSDTHLSELQLERPVAPGATGCTVDCYLPTLQLGIELKSAQHQVVPFVQAGSDSSEAYLRAEHNWSIRRSTSFVQDQAEMLFREVNRKCGDKELILAEFTTWLVVDTTATDWLDHISWRPAREEHLRQLAEAFTSLAERNGRTVNQTTLSQRKG